MVSKVVVNCPNEEEEPRPSTTLDLDSAKNKDGMNHTESIDEMGIRILVFHILINVFNQNGQIERNSWSLETSFVMFNICPYKMYILDLIHVSN